MEQVHHWRLLAVQSHFQLSVTASQPDKPASQGGRGGAERGAVAYVERINCQSTLQSRLTRRGEEGRNYAVSVTEPVQLVLRANERQVYISYRFKYR